MSREAIKTITDAEEQARKTKAEANAAAKKLIAEAEAYSEKVFEDARTKAYGELVELRSQAQNKARDEAIKLAKGIENRKAAMLVKADSHAQQAIALVVERIVNS